MLTSLYIYIYIGKNAISMEQQINEALSNILPFGLFKFSTLIFLLKIHNICENTLLIIELFQLMLHITAVDGRVENIFCHTRELKEPSAVFQLFVPFCQCGSMRLRFVIPSSYPFSCLFYKNIRSRGHSHEYCKKTFNRKLLL